MQQMQQSTSQPSSMALMGLVVAWALGGGLSCEADRVKGGENARRAARTGLFADDNLKAVHQKVNYLISVLMTIRLTNLY